MTVQLTPRLSKKPARFPNRIREYRVRAGLSQKALGERLGTTRKVISGWERGLHFPAGPVIFKLAKTLSTLIESLYLAIYTALRSDDTTTTQKPKK